MLDESDDSFSRKSRLPGGGAVFLISLPVEGLKDWSRCDVSFFYAVSALLYFTWFPQSFELLEVLLIYQVFLIFRGEYND